MSNMSISKKQGRLPKDERSPEHKRAYRMRRRAEQVDETRERITEAAVRLHTTIGPAQTNISKVAKEADVTRLTVYRHFADAEALYAACMGHWSAEHPAPDATRWQGVEPLSARARLAFGELYDWYATVGDDLYPIYRDVAAMPESGQRWLAALGDELAAAIVTPTGGSEKPGDIDTPAAIARHLVDFWTWRSLVVDHGLETTVAADAAVAMLVAVQDRAMNDQGTSTSD